MLLVIGCRLMAVAPNISESQVNFSSRRIFAQVKATQALD